MISSRKSADLFPKRLAFWRAELLASEFGSTAVESDVVFPGVALSMPGPKIKMCKNGQTKVSGDWYNERPMSKPIRNLDIFRQLPDGAPLWVGTSPNLEEAEKRVNQLASTTPGLYGVFDGRSGSFVRPFHNRRRLIAPCCE
jgi:hypothetical protein